MRRDGSALDYARVVEAVMSRRGQELAVGEILDGVQARVGMSGGELFHALAVLDREHRAGRVQQSSARCERPPDRLQDGQLRGSEACKIAGTAPPLDVGPAPRDARRAARSVNENPVKRSSVPPRPGVRGITECLDGEWAPDGIEVRSLCPSFIDTPLLDHTANAATNQGIRERVTQAGFEITPVAEVAQAA